MDETFKAFLELHRTELLALWHSTEKELRRAFGCFGDFAFEVMVQIHRDNHEKSVDVRPVTRYS